MKISNNENIDKIHSPKSRRSSRLRPKPFSDLTNIQTTLPEAEPKIEQEPGKEDLAPCRPDKFVFFSNLKFIPESEEVASTSGQDNNKNNELMESEDPLWLVKAIEKVKGENDLDASSQSCPIIGTKRSRKITNSVTHKQKVHGTFPLPASKTKKRKQNLVSPINIKEPLRPERSTEKQFLGAIKHEEPLRPERSTEKQFLGAIKHEEPLRSATSVKNRLLGSLIERENLLHSEASVETQSSKTPKKHKEPLHSEATVEKQSSKAPPIEHEEPSSAELNTDIKGPVLLPPEFVEERKAYFSQIDAFELEEESENSDDESTVV